MMTKVPSNINKEHILKAIEQIDNEGIEKGSQSSTYDLLYKEKRYPPKLVVSWANKYANGEILDRQSFDGGLKSVCFKVIKDAGFNVVEKESSISVIAEQFLKDAKSGNQKTKHYPKKYKDLNVKVSFGQGALAKVPWVAFLKNGEEVQKGIYPVLLLYKKLNCLVLSYGVSKTNPPDSSWNITNKQTTSEYLREKYGNSDDTYSNSYICGAYKIDEPLEKAKLEQDMEQIIKDYDAANFVSSVSNISEPTSEYSSDKAKVTMPPLNQILYGPPGTGKTYNTINKALEIIEPEFLAENLNNRNLLKERFDSLVEAERIGFVTFHQSFSYEDFVEGIKASTNSNGQVSYDIESGIFKKMCDETGRSKVISESLETHIDVTNRKIWKMSLGNTLSNDKTVYNQCIEKGYIALGYGDDIDFSQAHNRNEVIECYKSSGRDIEKEASDYPVTAVNTFKNEMSKYDLVVISDGNHRFRAIGEIAGDYRFELSDLGGYHQRRKVKWLKVFQPSRLVDDLFTKNLSQQTIYQLRKPTIDLDKLDKILNKSALIDDNFNVGDVVDHYSITFLGADSIELKKQSNGFMLRVERSLIDELVDLVKDKKLTLQEIRNRRVPKELHLEFDNLNQLEHYPNALTPLVEKKLGFTNSKAISEQPRVLIIDEINRGNIASIFGELITLIEPSKRAGGDETITVKLPYSKTPFSVPSNLYLIGTMNTADKSLAQVDIALRRRFEFIEMMTDHDVLKTIPEIEGIDVERLVKTINQRIELLYDREHTIGHSFFLPLIIEPTLAKLSDIFELQILPLLEEYFFEDWERVGQVLGDHLKSNSDFRFVIEKFDSSQISKLMGEDWEQSGIQPYVRNDVALTKVQAYIGIYES